MGHMPDDENYDEFMNSSAEEWSKSEPAPEPKTGSEKTNRWGSPIPDPTVSEDPRRWGSEPSQPARTNYQPPDKKSGSKWWIILIIVLVVLCLCACLVVFGLPALGISLFDWSSIQY